MNDQRKVIFEQRIDLMRDEVVPGTIADMRHAVVDELVAKHVPRECLSGAVGHGGRSRRSSRACSASTLPVDEWAKEEGIADEVRDHIADAPTRRWPRRSRCGDARHPLGAESIVLQMLDDLWLRAR